jgi:hypothetical protein
MNFIKIPIKKNGKVAVISYKNIKHISDVNHINFDIPNKYNVANLTGNKNNIIVIDVDLYKDGCSEIWNKLIKENGELNTTTIKTPSGGLHYYFNYNAAIKQTQNRFDNIDIRSDGGYILCPPSVINGVAYTYIKNIEPSDIPDWLFNYLSCPTDKEIKKISTGTPIANKETKQITHDNIIYNYSKSKILKMLNNLPPKYCDNNLEWFKISYILKSYNLKDEWQIWSKKSDKYNECQNLKTWNNDKKYNININYLIGIYNKLLKDKYLNKKFETENEKTEARNIFFEEQMNYANATLIYKPLQNDYKFKTIKQNNKYVKIEDENGEIPKFKTLLIRSDTGTGKTTAMGDFLKNNKDKNILSIVSRSSLASQHVQTFKKKGVIINDYNVVKNINNYNNMAVCLDSIIKFTCEPEEWNDTIVYLDEINSIVNYLTDSSTLNNKRIDIYIKLIEILNNAHIIIGTDADLSDVVFEFIKPYRNIEECLFIDNIHKNYNDLNAYYHEDKDDIIELMMDDVMNNNYFTACFTSKKMAEIIYKFIFDKNKNQANDFILLTSCDGNKIINDVSEEWKNKYVFYSPKIIYGVDFNPPNAQNVYILNSRSTINPLQIAQQMTRNRNIKNVHYWFNNEDSAREPLFFHKVDDVRDYYKQFIKEYHEKLNTFRGTRLINGKIELDNNEFINIFFINEFNDHIFKTNPIYHFKRILKNKGFKLINYKSDITTDERIKLKNSLKKTKMLITNQNKKRTKEAIEKYSAENNDLDININLFDENIFKKMDYLKLTFEEFENASNEYKKFIITTMADDNKFRNHLLCCSLFKSDGSIIFKAENMNEFMHKKVTQSTNQILTIRNLEKLLKVNTFDIYHTKHFENFDNDINYSQSEYDNYLKSFRIRKKDPVKPNKWGECYKVLIDCYEKLLPKSDVVEKTQKRDKNRKYIYTYEINKKYITLHCQLLINRQKNNINYNVVNNFYKVEPPTQPNDDIILSKNIDIIKIPIENNEKLQ